MINKAQEKTHKTKTKQYKPKLHHYYFYSTKPNIHERGLTKKKGEPIRLWKMSHLRSHYGLLPNGRYYEYMIRNDRFLKGKQCKEYFFVDEGNHVLDIALEIYESIPHQHVETQNFYFDVKGGSVKRSSRKDSIEKTTRRESNEKYAKFIDSHNNMEGHLTPQAYIHFVGLYNECQRRNISIPYRAKDWLCKIYSHADKPRIQKIYSDDFVAYKKQLEKNLYK
jgi:hypothetical protein